MDANLVEEITRLVILKLNEYSDPAVSVPIDHEGPEYPPLTETDFKKWREISSAIGGSSNQQTASHLKPLSEVEIKIWKELSASFRFGRLEHPDDEEPSAYPPLTEEELRTWGSLAGKTAAKR